MAAPAKFKAEFIKSLGVYGDNPIALTRNGKINNSLLARMFGVDSKTIGNWLTPGSGQYEPAFAKKVYELQEKIYSGDIKIGLMERARGYTEHKFIREPHETKIHLPSFSKMCKKAIIEYARYTLGIKVDSKLTTPLIVAYIRNEAEKMTKTELVITRHETKNIPADPAAAKMVLPNIQKKGDEENWEFKEDVNVNVTNLADIAAVMSAKKK